MIHFDFMVLDHVSKEGIWFKSTTSCKQYVFWWNPIKLIKGWIFRGIHIGCFPLHKNHIKL